MFVYVRVCIIIIIFINI